MRDTRQRPPTASFQAHRRAYDLHPRNRMVVPVQRIAQLGVQARSARDAVLRVVEMLKELHATIELPQGLFEHLANAVGAHEAAEAVLAAVIKENAAPSVVE